MKAKFKILLLFTLLALAIAFALSSCDKRSTYHPDTWGVYKAVFVNSLDHAVYLQLTTVPQSTNYELRHADIVVYFETQQRQGGFDKPFYVYGATTNDLIIQGVVKRDSMYVIKYK